jgi:hypothetical protein
VPIEAGSQFTWDRRFLVALDPGSKLDGMTVGPLGHKGWKQIRDRARSALPTQMCYAVPALFHQDQVISAPNLRVPREMSGFAAQFSPALSLLPDPFAVVSPDETPIFRETKSAKALETPAPAESGGGIGLFADG